MGCVIVGHTRKEASSGLIVVLWLERLLGFTQNID